MRAKFSSLSCDCVKVDLNNNAPGKQLDETRGEVNRLLSSLQNIISAANQIESIIKSAEQDTINKIKDAEAAKSEITATRKSTPRSETVTTTDSNGEKHTSTRSINADLIASYSRQIEECDQSINALHADLQKLKAAGDECSRIISEVGGYVNDVDYWLSRLSVCENEIAEECKKVLNEVKSAEESMRRYASVYPQVVPYDRIKHISEN